MQNEGLVQVTLFRVLATDEDVFGLGTTDQLLPFHPSVRVCVVVAPLKLPTAAQLVGVEQATPLR